MCLELGYRGAHILLGTALGTENGSWVIIMTSINYFYVAPGDASPGVGYSVGSASPTVRLIHLTNFTVSVLCREFCRDYPNAARFGVRLNCSNTADDEAAEVQKQEHSRE